MQIACVASSVQQTVDDLEPEQVVQVATPEEFVKSVENKDLDIVITNHIDLRYQPQKDGSLICKTGCDNALGVVTARSIRVCWVLSASTRLKTTTRCFPNALLQRSATQHPRMVSTRALIPV